MGAVTANDVAAEHQEPQRFIALPIPKTPPLEQPGSDIRIEARRGNLQVSVAWPPSAAADGAAWLRVLLR